MTTLLRATRRHSGTFKVEVPSFPTNLRVQRVLGYTSVIIPLALPPHAHACLHSDRAIASAFSVAVAVICFSTSVIFWTMVQ